MYRRQSTDVEISRKRSENLVRISSKSRPITVRVPPPLSFTILVHYQIPKTTFIVDRGAHGKVTDFVQYFQFV